MTTLLPSSLRDDLHFECPLRDHTWTTSVSADNFAPQVSSNVPSSGHHTSSPPVDVSNSPLTFSTGSPNPGVNLPHILSPSSNSGPTPHLLSQGCRSWELSTGVKGEDAQSVSHLGNDGLSQGVNQFSPLLASAPSTAAIATPPVLPQPHQELFDSTPMVHMSPRSRANAYSPATEMHASTMLSFLSMATSSSQLSSPQSQQHHLLESKHNSPHIGANSSPPLLQMPLVQPAFHQSRSFPAQTQVRSRQPILMSSKSVALFHAFSSKASTANAIAIAHQSASDTACPQSQTRSFRVYVAGLDHEVSSEALLAYFSRFGPVADVYMPKTFNTGRTQPFGFVTFATADGFTAALATEHHYHGKLLSVSAAQPKTKPADLAELRHECQEAPCAQIPRRDYRLFIGRLPEHFDEARLYQYFEVFGGVTDVYLPKQYHSGKPKGFGFVTFICESAVCAALAVPVHALDGVQLEVKRAQPREGAAPIQARVPPHGQQPPHTERLFVGRLPENLDEQRLRALFEQFGALTDVYLPKEYHSGKPKKFGFVTFASECAVSAALAAGPFKIEGCELDLKRAHPKDSNQRSKDSTKCEDMRSSRPCVGLDGIAFSARVAHTGLYSNYGYNNDCAIVNARNSVDLSEEANTMHQREIMNGMMSSLLQDSHCGRHDTADTLHCPSGGMPDNQASHVRQLSMLQSQLRSLQNAAARPDGSLSFGPELVGLPLDSLPLSWTAMQMGFPSSTSVPH